MKFENLLLLFGFPTHIPTEGEGGDDGGGDAGGDDGASDWGDGGDEGGAGEPGDGGEKTFTQTDVDKIVVKRNKALKQKLQKIEKSYENLLQQKNLTQDERDQLQADLESVQTQLRTKDQQAIHEAKKRTSKYEKELESTAQERDYFKNLYETSTRDQAITSAAHEHGAYNPEQFIHIIGNKTKIVEEVDDNGQKTGRLVPRVEVVEEGEDGTPNKLLKTPSQAIEDLKNQPEKFGNLFKSNVARGIGDGTSPGAAGNGRVDVTKMTDEEYFRNRDQIHQNLGIRQRRRV